MVTLSLVNCDGENIRERITQMREGFAKVVRQIRYRFGKDGFKAIRKLETTYNADTNTYHPHYHVLVSGSAQSELLRALWLKRFPDDAGSKGQDVRPCDEGSLVELFKYATKLTTKRTTGKQFMPARALDTIFQAIRGLNTWEPFGFTIDRNIEAAIEEEEITDTVGSVAFKRVAERIMWEYDHDSADWVDTETGELLSEYVPDSETVAMLDTIPVVPMQPEQPDSTDYSPSPIETGELPGSEGGLNFLDNVPNQTFQMGTTQAPELFVNVFRTKQPELSPG